MKMYGHVESVETFDEGFDVVRFDVTFRVKRDVAAEFMDGLIPYNTGAKRDPVGAILDHSADAEGAD